MSIGGFNSDPVERIRALLVEMEWTESDAWILVSELSDAFPLTLMQDTPTFASMPADEASGLICELERMLKEE